MGMKMDICQSSGSGRRKQCDSRKVRRRIRFFKDTIFPDNVKAKFGTGSDLQIYHDGTQQLHQRLVALETLLALGQTK